MADPVTTTAVVLTLAGGVFGCAEKGLSLLQKFPFASTRPPRILIERADAQAKKGWWKKEAREAINNLYGVLESCRPHARRILKEMLIRRITLLSGIFVLAVTALVFKHLFTRWYVSIAGLLVAFVISNYSLDIGILRNMVSSQELSLQKLSDRLNEQIKAVEAALAEMNLNKSIFYGAASRIKQLVGFAGALESKFLDAYMRLSSTVAAIEMRQLTAECGESMTSLRSYLNDDILAVVCETIVALVKANKLKAASGSASWEADQMERLRDEFRKVGLDHLLHQAQFQTIWKTDLYTLIKGPGGSEKLFDQLHFQDKGLSVSA